MTKKRKRYPDLNQKLERPWCYYCERDFDDLKILISHQKAKHFKCDRCGRRLNTAGGLSVHMNQVHKENLTHVENANPGRQGLEIEIFGMEGVPAEIIDQHNQQVTQAHFAEEEERARITGNPIRGLYANGQAPPNKRPKVTETLEEIEARAAQFRTDRKNGVLPVQAVDAAQSAAPPTSQPPYGAPSAFPPGASAPSFPPHGLAFPPTNGSIPARPGSIPGPPGNLPSRPGLSGPPPGILPPGHIPGGSGADFSTSIDDLIGEVTKGAAAAPPPAAAATASEKKSKKEKNVRLIFFDDLLSPEEKTAALPRFAEFARS